MSEFGGEGTPSGMIFTEWMPTGGGRSWRVIRQLAHSETPFQTIDVYETDIAGNLLVHDGAVMLTERDEQSYHEMLTHIPLMLHPNPKRVLVVGGGDGGVLREIVKHPSVEVARQVEIDGEVVRLSKEFFPTIACSYDHPKVDLIIGDGIKGVAEAEPDSYDVILIDSTDPVGPAAGLIEAQFYQNVFKALGQDGVLACQAESPFFHLETLTMMAKRLKGIFPAVHCYTSQIPFYPSGTWAFLLAAKNKDLAVSSPFGLDRARIADLEPQCHYWNGGVQTGCFGIPSFVKRSIEA